MKKNMSKNSTKQEETIKMSMNITDTNAKTVNANVNETVTESITENANDNTDENKNSEETIKMADASMNMNMNEENTFEIEDINLDGDDESTESVEVENTVNEAKTVENTATTFMVGSYKVSGLTQEQLEAALKAAGIATEIKPVKTTAKVVDKLQHDGDYAIDKTGERFDFASLTEEQKTESMKSGLSPKNLAILAQAAEIKKISGYRTRQVNSDQPATEKPGYQIREIIKSNLEMIGNDESLLNNLQDREFCKMNFKLSYPMFLDITGMDAVQIRSARKDGKGHDRYAPAIYEISNRQYLLTNDLYAKNLPLVKKFFHVG